MPAGGGDLQRPAGHGLAAHVGEIGRRWFVGATLRAGVVGPGASPVSASTTSPSVEATRTPHGDATWASALEVLGTTATTSPSTATMGATPGTRRSEPSRPSSPMKPCPVHIGRSQLLAGDEHADGDGQVEPGPGLARAGRGEVDGDRLLRPLTPRAEHGGPHPVPRLAAHRVGHARRFGTRGARRRRGPRRVTGLPVAPSRLADGMDASTVALPRLSDGSEEEGRRPAPRRHRRRYQRGVTIPLVGGRAPFFVDLAATSGLDFGSKPVCGR